MGVIQPSFSTNRQILGKVLPLSTPFTVIIDASERCNFRCNYCFRANSDKTVWGYANDNGLMSLEMFAKVLAQINDFQENVKTISLSNHGEPLCNSDLPQMVRLIHEKGMESNISIHTNGSLLRGRMLEKMIEADPGRVVVSIQGLKDEDYAKTCGYSIKVSELIENLRIFYNNKKSTKLYVKIVDVALRDDDEQLFYDTFLPISDRAYIERACDIWKTNDNRADDKKENYIKVKNNKFGRKFPTQSVCPVIFHTIVVAPNGDVYPCTQLVGQRKLGNINETTLLKMWNGEIRNVLLREQLTHDIETGACIGCGIKSNSFFTAEDLIDDYKEEVLARLEDIRSNA